MSIERIFGNLKKVWESNKKEQEEFAKEIIEEACLVESVLLSSEFKLIRLIADQMSAEYRAAGTASQDWAILAKATAFDELEARMISIVDNGKVIEENLQN